MTRIFISHSSKDTEIRDWFANVFAASPVQAVMKEFEQFQNVIPWQSITADIRHPDTQAVFVLLGPGVMGSQYTLNWVAFEVGVAAGAGKDVWVFERYENTIHFPVPYVNHYMRYNIGNKEHYQCILDLINGYQAWFPGVRQINTTNGARVINCPSDDCRAQFYYHNTEDQLTCPTCKLAMSFQPVYQARSPS